MILLLLSLLGVSEAATQCPCTFTINASSALTANVYPVIECDQICGPPALAYQYYSFEEPLGPCNCFTTLNGHYANATSSVNLYYQNGGTVSICDPCFPSPTPSSSPSPSVSPSGMCYVVNNLLYGKVYKDGYYTVVHGINASHAYNPSPIILGVNPTCTESPGICTCSYTGGSTFSCPYTRSATLRYQYGSTTTMSFVSESPVCRYTFNMFINFNSVTPTPSTSPSFTPAGSPTVSKTTSVSLSPSVSPSRSSSVSVTSSVTASISESELPIIKPFVEQSVYSPQNAQKEDLESTNNTNSITGVVLGTITVCGAIGVASIQLLQSRNTNNDQSSERKRESRERLSTIDEEESIVENVEEDIVELRRRDDDDDDDKKEKTLLQIDTEDVDAVMAFLRQRLKTGTVIYR